MNDLEKVKAFALSCVESYTLYSLLERHEPVGLLFSESYHSFMELLDYLHINNTSYAFYDGMKRIQDICLSYDVIDYKMCHDTDFLGRVSKDIIVLIQADSSVLYEKYNVKLWRDDHFLMLQNRNGVIKVINENPISITNLDKKFISDVYAGQYILMDIKGKIYEKLGVPSKKLHIKKSCDYKISSYSYEQIRDAVLIYKVCLKRILCYLQYLKMEYTFEKYIEEIEQMVLQIEYARLRKDDKAKHNILEKIFDVQDSIEENLLKIS